MNFINTRAKIALWRRDLDHCYNRDWIPEDVVQHVVIEVEDPITQQVRWGIHSQIEDMVAEILFRGIYEF